MSHADETARVFHRLKSGYSISPGKKVLKASELQSWQNASQMLIDVEQLQDSARAEHLEMKERAVREGLEQGRVSAMAEKIEMANAIADQLSRWIKSSEPQLKEIVLRSFRVLLDHVPADEKVAAAIQKGLGTLVHAKQITVRVSESDVESAKAAVEALESQSVSVVTDPTMAAGECVLETALGVLDLRPGALEAQLSSGLSNL